MAMEDVRISPSNGKNLSFHGELIAEASHDRVPSPDGERWLNLRIYRRVDAGFVPVIEFHSTHVGEEDATIAEVVDSGHDVENFFYVFEPGELLADKSLIAMPMEERQRLTGALLKLYDSVVNRVLLAMKACPQSEATDASEHKSVAKRKKGLLGLLGLK